MATVEHEPEIETHVMQAVALRRYGSADNLELTSIPRPKITAEQVLVKVHASSVNPIDWKLRQGMLKWVMPDQLPGVLGFDVAGEIAEVGYAARQEGWKEGDAVMAFSGETLGGCYAEYVAIDANLLVRKPDSLSFDEAAAIPLAGTTAWKSLVKLGRLRAGDDVLINGASGGVGTYAVQIAKALGAHVTAVCSPKNHDLVRQLGADEVLDYHAVDFTRMDRTYDIIFDAVSKSSFSDCRRVLNPHGHYIATLPSIDSVGFSVLSKLQRQSCHVVLARPDGAILRSLASLASEGKLRSIIDSVYPLSDLPAAHRKSEGGHVVGKIVIQVDQGTSGDENPQN